MPTTDRKAIWRIRRVRVWIARHYEGTIWHPGHFSHHFEWEIRYNGKRVAAYRTWAGACRHIRVSHERFGL